MSSNRCTQNDSAENRYTVRMPIGAYYIGVHIGATSEYYWTVRVRQWCGLMTNYFDHLLCIVTVVIIIIVIVFIVVSFVNNIFAMVVIIINRNEYDK